MDMSLESEGDDGMEQQASSGDAQVEASGIVDASLTQDVPSKESSSDEMETESSAPGSVSSAESICVPENNTTSTTGSTSEGVKSDWLDLNLEPSLNKRINESPAEEVKFATLQELHSVAKKGGVSLSSPIPPDLAMDWDASDRKESAKRQKSSFDVVVQDPLKDVIKDVILISKLFAHEDEGYDLVSILESLDATSPSYFSDAVSVVLSHLVSDWLAKKDESVIKKAIDKQKQRDPGNHENEKAAILSHIDQENDKVSSLVLFFLMQSYDVIESESKECHSSAPLVDQLMDARTQCICQGLLLLTNRMSNKVSKRILLPFLLNQWNQSFIQRMVIHCYHESGIEGDFSTIFLPLIESLRQEAVNTCSFSLSQRCKRPLESLSVLCDITVEGTTRPICQLITSLQAWIPDAMTASGGREISTLSFLSPFLSLSVFAEDDFKIVEAFYSRPKLTQDEVRGINQNLQFQLTLARNDMHAVLHQIILNSGSRDQALNFFAEVLKRNEKRAQLQYIEKDVATDGFMLNLLCVMQKLSMRVKPEKVDLMYPYHPKGRIKMRRQDSRLKTMSSEAESWVSSIPETEWQEIKFATECFFLTLESHHISLIPCIRKYTRRIRAIREYSRVADELQSQEPLYRSFPVIRQRNETQIRRWKEQAKRLTKAKTCADAGLMDQSLLSSCLHFYCLHMGVMLRAAGAWAPGDDGWEERNPTLTSKLPLPETVAKAFASYPEWYV